MTGLVVFLGIYDLVAVSTGGVVSSVSRFLQWAGFQAPALVFAIGFICGHIFWYMPPRVKADK